MEPGTTFTSLSSDTDERFVPLRRSLGVTTFGINQIVLQPRQRLRIHRHRRQEEVYLVVSGTLTLLVEGEEHTVETGGLARVAPDVRRQLVNTGTETLSLVALGGAEAHDGRDGEAFLSWEVTEPAEPRDVPFPDDLPA
jgi:quercetin dioxygenase-like cupin family protein